MSNSSRMSPAMRLLEESGLAATHEPIDVTLVSHILDQRYGLSGRLEPLATEKDDTFRLRGDASDHLVKVSPPDEAEQVVGLQTAAMRFLERTAVGLPVQRVKLTLDGHDNVVVTIDDGTTRVLRVLEFIDGAVLAETMPNPTQLAQVGEVLGRIDVALESFQHPAAGRGLVWDIRQFHHLADLVEHLPSREHQLLAKEVFRLFGTTIVPRLNDLEIQMIHGDYGPHNIVVDPQRDDFVVGVIDFGDAVRSAAIFDPAVSLANLVGRVPNQPWRDAGVFVTGYERSRAIKDSELPLLPVAALARLTVRALITNWRAERAPARRDYLLAHVKDDWTNVDRAMSVRLDDVPAQLRDGYASHEASPPKRSST